MDISQTKVPNEGDPRARLWFVGEAPGAYEEEQGRPFVGPAGQKLMDGLSACGIGRKDVFLANCCNYRPAGNDFGLLEGSPQLEQSLSDLFSLARAYHPHCIGLLGAVPLRIFTKYSSISSYRGSILCADVTGGTKVIPTYHPSYILRVPSDYPIWLNDLKRIVADAAFPDLRLTDRQYIIDPSPDRLHQIHELVLSSSHVAVDIECTRAPELAIICVGLGLSAHIATCLPYTATNFSWLKNVLEDETIRKIFHNGQFDVEVLHLRGIEVRNFWFDTMVAQHILEPELPKRLDHLTSIYTREPYYKAEGRGALPEDTKAWSSKTNKADVYVYNAKDCAVTYEIHEHQLKELTERGLWNIYNFEHSLIPVATHISRSGIGVDQGLRTQIRLGLERKLQSQEQHLSTLTGQTINIGSPKQVSNLLLDMGLKREGKSTGEDALISLIGFCTTRIESLVQEKRVSEWKRRRDIVQLILDIRETRKYLSSYVNVRLSDDGRLRSSYGVAATETGRWSARKYVDGTGLNAQTFPRGDIDFEEDEGLEGSPAA
jgi:uracil-DNA glycosylase